MVDLPTPQDEGVCRVVASGEVDIATVGAILDDARRCLATNPATVEIDLGGVTFIDSSGLGALVQVRNLANEQGAALVLVSTPHRVRRLLQVSGLDQVFEIRASD